MANQKEAVLTDQSCGSTIPSSLLQSLKQGTSSEPKRHSNVKLPPLTMITSQTTSPSDSIWYYHKQRKKFKHLTDNTQCVCGAGRDISFLYDATLDSTKDDDSVPQTLIPNEYHLVKHPGVLGLEFHDEPYTAHPESHERHLTTFPSLKPSGRHEVMYLKNAMYHMMEKAGISNQITDSDLAGPTQMHNLISLVKKEQEIYNVCFHELIRQVSVNCSERGELLAEIRECYSNLLNRIPQQVKSLHDELAVQRTLDKKLTSELGRFKTLMTCLTSELSDLKDHNEITGEEILETKDNLSLAISDSEKNANLLGEYCELYELQRKRLEDHIALLVKEKDLWEHTSYRLAIKVAKKHQLKTVQQIQLNGKSWEKIATHFTIMIADKDTKELSNIQRGVRKWRRDVIKFTQALTRVEENLQEKLCKVEEDMQKWFAKLQSNRLAPQVGNDESNTSTLDKNDYCVLWQALVEWLKVLNELSETFSGEILLERQEGLQEIQKLMREWSEMALSVTHHHITPHTVESVTGDESVVVQDKEGLCSLVDQIKEFTKDLAVRTSGENGVAIAFVHLITPMESWDTKLNVLLSSEGKHLSDSDTSKLLSQVELWLNLIRSTRDKVSMSSQNTNQVDVDTIIQATDKWCSIFSRAVQVEDGQVIEQVIQLHSSLVKWMVDILLYLTSETDEQVDILSLKSKVFDLKNTCTLLCDQLNKFTTEITKSCNLILEDMSNEQSSEVDLEVEEERQHIQNLHDEAVNWIRLSSILIDSCTITENLEDEMKEEESSRKEEEEEEEFEKDDDTSTIDIQEEPEFDKELLKTVLTIGPDDNVEEKKLVILQDESYSLSLKQLNLATEEELPEGRGGQTKDAEKLLLTLDEIKYKLVEQENMTNAEKDRADSAERKLIEVEEELSRVSLELKKAHEDLKEISISKNNIRKTPKGQKSKQDNKKNRL